MNALLFQFFPHALLAEGLNNGNFLLTWDYLELNVAVLCRFATTSCWAQLAKSAIIASRQNPAIDWQIERRISSMTLLYTNDKFLQHQTGKHPERPERLMAICRQLQRSGLDQRCERLTWEPISPERLALVHGREYVTAVRQFAEAGGGRIEADTVVSPASFEVASLAAGAVCDAVQRVVAGEDNRALCLVRPPGHHALPAAAMGFCLFNNIALGARMAIDELQLNRVLIVDFDVHHGNGTQDTFWEEERVGFLSMHRFPFYPGTGQWDETGRGRGLGTTRNLPIEFGQSRSEILKHFAVELENFAAKIKPELVLLSAGFDAHREDPVGSLGLETEDFEPLTESVLDVANAYAGGRVVSVLEGGYNTSRLAGCVELHLERLAVSD
jgi:acetoin utilization deacetylase AcuC-like enzyme